MDKKDIDRFEERLKQEEATLELELADLGVIQPAINNNITAVATSGDVHTGTADLNELADADEERETNKGIIAELSARHAHVTAALQRIKEGTYGTCTNCGVEKEIPMDRLEANPAADTCLTCT